MTCLWIVWLYLFFHQCWKSTVFLLTFSDFDKYELSGLNSIRNNLSVEYRKSIFSKMKGILQCSQIERKSTMSTVFEAFLKMGFSETHKKQAGLLQAIQQAIAC